MATFIYKVRDKMGKVLQGQMDAVDGKDLRRKLDEQGYFIIECYEKQSGTAFNLEQLLPMSRKVSLNNLSVLSWQLFTMLDAGLTLISALKIIEKQTKNKYLQEVINDVWHRIEEGVSFSEALKEHPRVFSRLYVQMVNAGEVGGVLDEMLKRVAMFYERQAQIRSKIRSALVYPMFLLVVSIFVIIFLISYVLPQFATIFESMGVQIPFMTKVLLQISVFVEYYWYAFLIVPIAASFIYRIYTSTYLGKLSVDKIKISIPLVGEVIKKTTAARFTQTLATLLSGGIPILTALEVVIDTIGNTIVVKALKEVYAMVGEGKSIAQPLEESKIFPDMVVGMIKVGEETGSLENMLNKISEFYDREVYESIETFTKMIEPCLIVFMTSVIGLIATSIFLPMTDLMQGMHG